MDKPITVRKKRYTKWIVIAIALIALILVTIRYQEGAGAYKIDKRRLQISTVRKERFKDTLSMRAYVEPLKSVYLDAIEGGRVEKVLVEEGDIVEKGQLLIELSNTALQLDIISREAQVNEQLNDLRNTKLAIEKNRLKLKSELAKIDYEIKKVMNRATRLEKVSEYVSKETLDSLSNELGYARKRRSLIAESQKIEEEMRSIQVIQLEKNVAQQDKNLKIAQENLDQLIISAPRKGRISGLSAEVGESKRRGERLGKIDDTKEYKLTGNLAEYYLRKIFLEQKVNATIDNTKYILKISKIYPEIKNNTFEIDLLFSSNTPKNIRKGQSFNVDIHLSELETILIVDNGNFLSKNNMNFVFVLDKKNKTASKRTVKFGRKTSDYIEVLSGIKEGESIIISDYQYYTNENTIHIEQ